jgi:viologen exporter family transport system permease protein
VTPRRRAGLRAHAAIAAVSARQAAAARVELLARAGLYVVILVVFSRLWRATSALGAPGPTELLWYLAATEWVLLSIPLVHLDLERDVRQGEVATLLARPVPWLSRRIAEALGQLAVRLAVLGVVGVAAARLLAGSWPSDPRGLLATLVVGVAGGVFGVLAQSAIGLAAVWMTDVAPLFWIWQKSAFFLGGLILPLSLYPAWLRDSAVWTPFAAYLYGPGRLAMGLDLAEAARDVALLLGWTLLALLLLRTVHRRALRVLDVNGG